MPTSFCVMLMYFFLVVAFAEKCYLLSLSFCPAKPGPVAAFEYLPLLAKCSTPYEEHFTPTLFFSWSTRTRSSSSAQPLSIVTASSTQSRRCLLWLRSMDFLYTSTRVSEASCCLGKLISHLRYAVSSWLCGVMPERPRPLLDQAIYDIQVYWWGGHKISSNL